MIASEVVSKGEEILVLALSLAQHWRYLAGALAVFLLTMGFVVTWLTIRIGNGLRHRLAFRMTAMLFACSGLAQAVHAVADTTRWPAWLAQGMQSFMLAALGILSVFMIASIPPLLEVLRASDEVLSLRGQAKFQAVVQAAPMAVMRSATHVLASVPMISSCFHPKSSRPPDSRR